MLKAGAFAAMLPAIVLCTPLDRFASEKPKSQDGIAKGTRPVIVKLTEEVPERAVVGTAVDIVGEISEPIKTGIALLNVKLLATDSPPIGEPVLYVTVQLTPVQLDVLHLMQKHGMKLEMKLREKEKPKQ